MYLSPPFGVISLKVESLGYHAVFVFSILTEHQLVSYGQTQIICRITALSYRLVLILVPFTCQKTSEDTPIILYMYWQNFELLTRIRVVYLHFQLSATLLLAHISRCPMKNHLFHRLSCKCMYFTEQSKFYVKCHGREIVN